MNRTTSQQQLYTTEITNDDVLLGRGIPITNYSGNVRFRQLVVERKEMYCSTCQHQIKNELAREIIKIIKDENGGRFIREIKTTAEAKELGITSSIKDMKHWVILDDKTIMQKVKQALREPGPPKSPPRSIDFMRHTERTEIQKTLSFDDTYKSNDQNGLRDILCDVVPTLHQTTLTQQNSMLMPAAGFSPPIPFCNRLISSTHNVNRITAEFSDNEHQLNAMYKHQSSMPAAPPLGLCTKNDVEMRKESISDQILNQVRKRNQEQHEQLAQRARSISYPSIVADIDRIQATRFDEQQKIVQQHLSNLILNRSLSSPLFATQIEHSIRRHQNTFDIRSQPELALIRTMSDGLISSGEAAHRILEVKNQLNYLDTSAQTGLTMSSNLIQNQTNMSSGSILSLLLAQEGVSAKRKSKSSDRSHEYSRDSKSDAITNMMLASHLEMLSENQTYRANIGTTTRVIDRSSTINGLSSPFNMMTWPFHSKLSFFHYSSRSRVRVHCAIYCTCCSTGILTYFEFQ